MTRFVSTAVDPRRLSMLPHQMARQHPGRREHVHGRIRPMRARPERGRRDPPPPRLRHIALLAALWLVSIGFLAWCGSIRL